MSSIEVQHEDKGGGGGGTKKEESDKDEKKKEKEFTKPDSKRVSKFNLPKHKLKRLSRQNSRSSKHSVTHKDKTRKFSRKRARVCGKFLGRRRNNELGSVIIPPTKFLLGGNIRDPLNLNSLQDEEINRAMNAVTPKSSPLPTPQHKRGAIEVIIPRNIKDPLNLISGDDNEMDIQSCSKKAKKNRHRKRKRNNSGREESLEVVEGQELDSTEKSNEVQTASCLGVDLDVNIEGATIPQTTDKPEEKPIEPQPPPPPQHQHQSLMLPVKHKRNKIDIKDKIVSPVIPQPGAWKRLIPVASNRKKITELPPFNPKNTKYQYGNYDRYYGYRNQHHEVDTRLQVFFNHRELFLDKDILDIGCNIGHMTLSVARDLGARSAVGLDIDKKLINIARKNVKHYVNCTDTPAYGAGGSVRKPFDSPMCFRSPYCLESPSYTPSGVGGTYFTMDSPSYQPSVDSPSYQRCYHIGSPSPLHHNIESTTNTPRRTPPTTTTATAPETNDKFFPISMPILYGPVDPPGISTHKDSVPSKFPHNVTFVQGNYVLESDALLSSETPQFDVILCLSITKWIHLNWGDCGLKQAFKRMFLQLRPGGKLILEPQSFSSYKKRKNLTETTYRYYHNIEFFPYQFTQFLLSSDIGFSKVDVIGTPTHRSKGFSRPIQVFTKQGLCTPSSGGTPGSSVRFTPYSQRHPVYSALTVPIHELDESLSPTTPTRDDKS